MKQLYVGNLPFTSTEEEIKEFFEEFGVVNSVRLITEKLTGRARGFGFVEMENDEEADVAIAALEGAQFGGRTLKVSEAKPRQPKRRPVNDW